MLFIIFTEKYTYRSPFEKLNTPNFSKDDNNILYINQEREIECVNTYDTYPIPLKTNLMDAKVIIVNDIDLDGENTILCLLRDVISEHAELFVLYHTNGNITNHIKWIEKLAVKKQIYQEEDSHVEGSLYYDEFLSVVESISINCSQAFKKAIDDMYKWFVTKERNRFIDKLVNISLIANYQEEELPKLLLDNYISLEYWNSFKDEMKILSAGNSENSNIKKYDIINKYFK